MAVAYISGGSNLGDRVNYLQLGIQDTARFLGKVLRISSLVETPAVGFDGNSFLNVCFSVETHLSAEAVMQTLLNIELSHGRIRSQTLEYQNRTLDLDLLFYEDEVITSTNLILPHPSLEKRRFVLHPLAEIAPNKVHPIHQKTILELLHICSDMTQISTTEHRLLHPLYAPLLQHSFICVEGIIGCGKTTLANMLASSLGYKVLEERFEENPFLPKFYRKAKRYAFPLELSFLADRFKQIHDDAKQLDLFQSGVVADYHISKSLVFAKNTLSEDEYFLFQQLYELISRNINPPGLCIYLRQTPERALKNIKKRGRSYEQNIGLDYLENLSKGYEQHLPFLRSQMQVAAVDVTDLDFVLTPDHVEELLQRVTLHLDVAE